MFSDSKPAGVTRVGVLAVIVALGILLALLLPAIQAAREAARTNTCDCHMKGLGLAIHNYHGLKERLPAVTTTNIVSAIPGLSAADPQTAGYSWIVQLLPYLEERALYDQIARASDNFTLPAFSPAITSTGGRMSQALPHISMTQLPSLRCPSYTGPSNSAAPQYGSYQTQGPDGKLVTGCAVGNVIALSATHLACLAATESNERAEPPNGMLIPPSTDFPTGLKFKDVTDGLSKTIMAAETVEPRYSAWYDGTVNYAVAADPNTAKLELAASKSIQGEWVGPRPKREWLAAAGGTALNVGPAPNPNVRYRTAANFSNGGGAAWSWGPSSQHSGGAVVHLYGDGAVRFVTDDIDPTIYMWLVTRAGDDRFVVGD